MAPNACPFSIIVASGLGGELWHAPARSPARYVRLLKVWGDTGVEDPRLDPQALSEPEPVDTGGGGGNCDASHPGVCIAPYPPDLDCGDVPYTNFKVTGSDRTASTATVTAWDAKGE